MSVTIKVANDVQKIERKAGEAQSTVIAPGKKPNCPNGRILTSIDYLRANYAPPAKGSVVGRNLNDPNSPLIESEFEKPPNAQFYMFNTNDHDLVSLSNGDVLYITGASSRVPLTPKPDWFDVAYRGNFGPGARSVVLTWRSTDGGETFQFVSEIDPAREGDGSGALPQFPRLTTPPGSPDKPVFDMGGSDGQLAKVDADDDRVYLTFPCVGYQRDTTQKQRFELSQNWLNKTLVMASLDSGSTWTNLGFVGILGWRNGIVPLEPGQLAFGVGMSNRVIFGQQTSLGNCAFDTTAQQTAGSWGWNETTFTQNAKIKNLFQTLIYVNMGGHTVVTRSPGSNNVALAFPTTATNTAGQTSHGYRLFFYDRATQKFAEAAPILPAKPNTDNFLMHLTAIDLGRGPVLLYWYDVDTNAKTATIRGRLITGHGEYSSDFAISQAGGQPRKWNLDQGKGHYWYGDYLTAGGFVDQTLGIFITHNYYPMWVEPDGTIRYTLVSATRNLLPAAPAPNLTINLIPNTDWKPGPPPEELSHIRLNPQELDAVREYSRRQRRLK